MNRLFCLSIFILFFLFENNTNAQNADSIKYAADNRIFSFIEQMPQFSGGEDAFKQYITEHFKYPEKARINQTEGKVVIQFIVRYDGNITDVKILRDIGYGCGQAIVDVVRKMPKWNVGKQNGKPVSCFYTFPFDCSLN